VSIFGLLIVLAVVALLFGGWGATGGRNYGYWGWSPVGLIFILLLLYLVGVIH
jgi:hypothetical protein